MILFTKHYNSLILLDSYVIIHYSRHSRYYSIRMVGMAKKAKVLTSGDIKLAMAVASTHRNQCILMLSILAGLRAVEVANLTVDSVIGSDGKVLGKITFTKSQTKGNKSREVPVSKKLAKYISEYLKSQPARRLECHRPLFISQKTNEAFSAHGIVMLLQRIYRTAGITGASSHSGRRTFATTLASKGVSVFVLKELMGHSHINTTSGYVHTGEHQQINAVNLL